MEISRGYPVDGLVGWWRGVGLDPGTESVTVVDSWEFATGTEAPPEARTAWHWLLAGTVSLAPGRAVVQFAPDAPDAPAASRALSIAWDPAAVVATLDVRHLDDPELSEVWGEHLTRLRLTARAETPSGTFRVTMRPTGSEQQEAA